MRMRQKILVDRCLGTPCAYCLNVLARLLGFILNRDHSVRPDNVRRVVIAKFAGMGSILQATPLIRMLRQNFPKASITLLTGIANRDLVQRLPEINHVLFVDDRGPLVLALSCCRTVIRLIKSRADLYFDLEVYSAFASCMAIASMTRNRLGFYRHSARFKRGIYTHLVYFNTRRPVWNIYCQLGSVATSEQGGGIGQLLPLKIFPADREGLYRKLRRLGAFQDLTLWRYVVINPNASDLLLERRWPTQHFVQVIAHLVSGGLWVTLIGSSDEVAHVEDIWRRVPSIHRSKVINTAGKLEFGELLSLMETASCVITNDTGPFHFAVALGVPVVGLFGPGHPAHYGANRENVVNMYREVFCSPCLYEIDEPPCAGKNMCMQLIDPGAVISAATRLLSEASTRNQGDDAAGFLIRDDAAYRDSKGQPLGVIRRSSLTAGFVGSGGYTPRLLRAKKPSVRSVQPCEVCGSNEFRSLFIKHAIGLWQCTECGLERIFPPPDAEQLQEFYGPKYYESWGLDANPEGVRQIKIATFRKRLNSLGQLPKGMKLLDCGAATGFLMELAAELGFEPYGVDVSPLGARDLLRKFGPDRIYSGMWEDASFSGIQKAGFHVVCMFDFLEHVRDPRGALRKAHGLLVPGGDLLLTTPDSGSLSRRIMGFAWPHIKLEHLIYFNRFNLALLLMQEGFSVVRMSGAWKILNLRYVSHQLETYPVPILSPLFHALSTVLPDRLRDRAFPALLGEVLVHARKS